MSGERVRQYLDEAGVEYEQTEHQTAVDAQRVAAAEHESGWRVAKPVMLKVGSKVVMAVVPAPVQVDLRKVRAGLGRDDVTIADEREFAPLFPDCDVGAEPIFGNVYDVPVYFDRSLQQDPYLVFRDGSHQRTLKVRTEEFVRLVRPETMDIGSLGR